MKVSEINISHSAVRKYEPETGSFLLIVPLWENYYSWTPYHYCGNAPGFYNLGDTTSTSRAYCRLIDPSELPIKK